MTLGATLGHTLGARSFFEPLRFEPSAFFQGFDESFLQIVAYNHNSSRPLYCQQGQSGRAHSGHADALRNSKNGLLPSIRGVIKDFVPEQEADPGHCVDGEQPEV
jgi:hypothetical protein